MEKVSTDDLTSNRREDTDYTELAKGVQSLPKHLFEQKIGQGCADVITKKINASKYRNDTYRAFSWTQNDDIYERLMETAFDLDHIDERFSSVLSHGEYKQQGIGIPAPTAQKRRDLSLPDPFDDPATVGGESFSSLYVACIDTLVECFREGVKQAFPDPKDSNTDVLMKKTSMKGAPKCWHGDDANVTFQKEVLDVMRNDPNGLYAFAYKKDFAVTIGFRAQDPRMVVDENGNYLPKHRSSAVFPSKEADYVVASSTYDATTHVGKRVRHVFNMPMITNVVLMTVNSYVMENLSPKMKEVFKHTPESVLSVAGNIVHCADFSGFDQTIPPEIRHYAMRALYSEAAASVGIDMDHYPIAGAYTEYGGEDGVLPIFYYIDRTNDQLAQEISPLTSGTGDTALLGKVLGCADQLRRVCLAANASPSSVMNVGNPNDTKCLGAQAIRNQGDDSMTIIDPIAEAVGDSRERVSHIHAELISGNKLFDISMELPGKFIGYLLWSPDPVKFPVWAVSHDPVAMLSNNIFREHGFNSPIRSDEVVGLSGSMEVYKETIVPVIGEDSWDEIVSRMLWVIDSPYTEEELHEEAKARLETPESYLNAKYGTDLPVDQVDIEDVPDFQKADYARAKLAELFQLKNPDELDWKVDRAELLHKAPKELLDQLTIVVDKELTAGVENFVKL